MHRIISLALVGAAALALSGCDHHGRGGHHEADTAKIADEIKAKEAQWLKDYQSKDLEALVGQYSDDAAIAGPGDALATSDTDRRKALQGLIGDPNFALNFASDRVLVAQVRRSRDQSRPLQPDDDRQGDQQACDRHGILPDRVPETG